MASGVADLIDRIEGMALDAEEVVAVREVLSRRLVDVSLANLSDKNTVELAQAVFEAQQVSAASSADFGGPGQFPVQTR